MEVQSEDIKVEPVDIVDAVLPEERSELDTKNEEIKCEPRFRVELERRSFKDGLTETFYWYEKKVKLPKLHNADQTQTYYQRNREKILQKTREQRKAKRESEGKRGKKMCSTMAFMRQHKLPRPWGLMYKRKLIWDEQKVMSNPEMSRNIRDPSDTLATSISMAPPTKFLMHWRQNGGIERIMGAPGKPLKSQTLINEYTVRKVM